MAADTSLDALKRSRLFSEALGIEAAACCGSRSGHGGRKPHRIGHA